MSDVHDPALLRQFIARGSEEAFAELVRRHVDLVWSAARRQSRGDDALAEDVTQSVFVLLAQKARSIREGEALAGWLLVTTRYVALNALRAQARRRRHEREAAEMNTDISSEPSPDWDAIAQLLDEAVAKLKRDDRDALALRFFQGRSISEVATAMGISVDAAQKRVTRAVGRLRDMFAARGIESTDVGLASLLSANALMIAPAALTATLTGAALAPAAGAASVLSGKGLVALMAAAKAKLAMTCAAGAILLGVTGTIAYQEFLAAPRKRQVQVTQSTPAMASSSEFALTPTTIPANWEPRFSEVYGLKDGELIKFVPAPFIPERLGFYRKTFGESQFQSWPPGPDTMLLVDSGGELKNRNAMWGGVPTVRYAARYAMDIQSWDLRGAERLLRREMRGDWVIREGTTPEQRRVPFLQILSEMLKAKVSLDRQVIPREAIVITGTLDLHPIVPTDPSPGRRTPVLLYRGKVIPKKTGYGGGDLATQLAGICNIPVIDEAGLPGNLIEVRQGVDVYLSDHIQGQQREKEIDALLANIAAQTSLELKREMRTLPVWTLSTQP